MHNILYAEIPSLHALGKLLTKPTNIRVPHVLVIHYHPQHSGANLSLCQVCQLYHYLLLLFANAVEAIYKTRNILYVIVVIVYAGNFIDHQIEIGFILLTVILMEV